MYKAANRNKILIILIVLLLLCISGLVYWYLNIYLCNVSPKGYEFLEKFIVSKECHTREYELRGTIYNVKDNGDSVSFDMNVWGEEGSGERISLPRESWDGQNWEGFDYLYVRYSFVRKGIFERLKLSNVFLDRDFPVVEYYSRILLDIRREIISSGIKISAPSGSDYRDIYPYYYLENPLFYVHVASFIGVEKDDVLFSKVLEYKEFFSTEEDSQDANSKLEMEVDVYNQYKTQACSIIEGIFWNLSEDEKSARMREFCDARKVLQDINSNFYGNSNIQNYTVDDFLSGINEERIINSLQDWPAEIGYLNERELFQMLEDLKVVARYYPENAQDANILFDKVKSYLINLTLTKNNYSFFNICFLREILSPEASISLDSSISSILRDFSLEDFRKIEKFDPLGEIYCSSLFLNSEDLFLRKWSRSVLEKKLFLSSDSLWRQEDFNYERYLMTIFILEELKDEGD